MAITSGEESSVVDFTAHLLGLLDYHCYDNFFIRQRKEIRYSCAASKHLPQLMSVWLIN